MTGGTAVDAVRETFVHPALFYRDDHDYLAGTVPFVTEGLAGDEPVAVSVPPARLAVLRRALGTAAERVHMLDMTEVGRNPGRIIPGVLRAFADTYPGQHVRIIGEPIWPQRSAAEYPACAQHEALINHAFAGRRVTILCPYDTVGLDPLVLADAARTHPLLVDANGSRASDRYAPDEVVADYNRPLTPPEGATVLTADTQRLAYLRRVAGQLVRQEGLSEKRADDVVLVLTELVTNSIEHAGSAATVTVGRDGDHVVCQVHDSGHLTDPLAGRRPEVPGQQRGRGLLLVNYLADLVRVHTDPGGTTVETRFAVTP